ncbi:MAG: hypothetical protein WC773_03915 [Patescibacteria group bacterium]|jgi:hypothetical protein
MITDIWNMAIDQYHVNPIIFIVIYVVTYIPCWLIVFKIVKMFKHKNTESLYFYILLELALLLMPYLYVLLFGRNLPIWAYLLLFVLIIMSVNSTYRYCVKLLKNKKTGKQI